MPKEVNSEAAVTDEMLDAAAAEVEEKATTDSQEQETETKVEQTEETDSTKEDVAEEQDDLADIDSEIPADHGERSRLGRKVAAMFKKQDRIEEILEKLSTIVEDRLTTNQQPSSMEAPTITETEEDTEDFTFLTKKDLDRYLEMREQQKLQASKQYENNYIKTVKELSSRVTPEEHEEIVQEMMANFNIRYSDDPIADAERNYLKAERSLLRKKLAKSKKENPLKGDKPRAPLGVAKGQRTQEKSVVLPDLDPDARDFLEYIRRKEGDEAAEKYHKSLLKKPPGYLKTG